MTEATLQFYGSCRFIFVAINRFFFLQVDKHLYILYAYLIFVQATLLKEKILILTLQWLQHY